MRSINLVSKLVGSFGIALGVVVISPAAHAGGDAAAGKTLSVACQACHVGVDPKADTPQLVGQRETYIAKQLKAFKAGDRKNPVMHAMATQLSDADIANLAAYWSSQAPGSDVTPSEEVIAIRKAQMTIPKDFPKGYILYSTVNKEDQPVVSKSYVNAIGFAAVKANKPLPDGTSIVVANYDAKVGADGKPLKEADGTYTPDKLKGYAGMEARAGWGKAIPELLRNANWNYGVFGPDKSVKPVPQTACLACHKPQASTSYLFLLKDIQAKAAAK